MEKREVKNKGEWGEVEKRKEKMGRIGIEKKGRGRKWDEVKQRKVESGEWEEVRGVGEKKGKMGCIGIEKKGRGRKWDEVEQRKVENGKKGRYWS